MTVAKMISKKRPPLVEKDGNTHPTPSPKKQKKWGTETTTPTGMLSVGRTLQLASHELKNGLRTLGTAARAAQIGAKMFLSKVPDMEFLPIIRPPVNKQVPTKKPKKGSDEKKSNNANKTALRPEEIKIILDRVRKASRRGKGEYDRVILDLGVIFDRAPKTIRRLISTYSKLENDDKNRPLEMKKRGRRCKISEKGFHEIVDEVIECEEKGEFPTRKDMVNKLCEKAKEEGGDNAKLYQVRLQDSTKRNYLAVLRTQLSDKRKMKGITDSRLAAQSSFRSAYAFYCMVMAFIVLNYSPTVGMNRTIDPRLIFNSDPTFIIAHPDPKQCGDNRRWCAIGAKNLKQAKKSGNTLFQSIKLLSACSAAGEQSEIVCLKKISFTGFDSNTGHPGIWRLKLPGFHPIIDSRHPRVGHLWIYDTGVFKRLGEDVEERIAKDFDSLIFQPFRDGILQGSFKEECKMNRPPPRSIHMFDGEAAWLNMTKTVQYKAQCLKQNMLMFKSSAARSASEQPMDVMSCFLTLKSLFRNLSILFDDNDPINEQLKQLLDNELNTNMTAPEGLKAMLRSVIPRLVPAMTRSFTQAAIKKGFLIAGVTPVRDINNIGTAWDRIMARCPGYDNLTQAEANKFKGMRYRFIRIAKETGYIPELEFDAAGFPKDLNWEEEAIPKDLLTMNRRRAMIVNHEAGPQNEAIIAAARLHIEAERQKAKLQQQSDKQITSTLDRFATKCLPNAPLKGAADYACHACKRTHSGWQRVTKKRKKKDPTDTRWCWSRCPNCTYAACSLAGCVAALGAHTASCMPTLPPGAPALMSD